MVRDDPALESSRDKLDTVRRTGDEEEVVADVSGWLSASGGDGPIPPFKVGSLDCC